MIRDSRGASGLEREIREVVFCLSARAEDDEAGDEAEADTQKDYESNEEVYHRWRHGAARAVTDDESRNYGHYSERVYIAELCKECRWS